MNLTELYKIVVDGGSASGVYYWNNSDVDIVYDGDTYTPEVVSRSDMVQGDEINRQNIQIRIAPDNPLAQMYYKNPPEVVVTVTIFRKEDETVLTYWKGRVAATRSTDWECVVECESVYTSMRRTGARARYQVQCRHALYGTACGVNKENYAVAGTVSAVDGTSLTVTGADGEADGYFVGGMIAFNGVFRFIVGHTGTSITLWRELPGVEATDAVTLYPGCNRTLDNCTNKFSNTINFGGFPWLPNSNPFSFINIY